MDGAARVLLLVGCMAGDTASTVTLDFLSLVECLYMDLVLMLLALFSIFGLLW